ncbi:MAG: 3-phosphoshikimate 1-carboxyvinyltransferase [Euryarchaeota archaeon]|nr:3-phosphoshikimate 1-carboxyvinyltransferase [Euryarchaeota archaeon]
MILKIRPSEIGGKVHASPSKSYTHRAIVLASLAQGTSKLGRPLLSGDTLATLEAMRAFGATTSEKDASLIVEGCEPRCPSDVIDAANSGTTIRIVAGIASLLPCYTVLTGDESIRRRPMQPLIDALSQLGVECRSTRGNGLAPLIVRGPNVGGLTKIQGDVSSQFISSLLISSPLKKVDTEVVITTELKSKPYIDITMDMMSLYGVRSEGTDKGFFIRGNQAYKPHDLVIPGDYSSAAFPLAAGVLAGSAEVDNLDPGDMQGDRLFMDILERFGAKIGRHALSVRASGGKLEAADIDLGQAPDLFPIVAVVASQAKGESVIRNAEHVRHKESDRISATVTFLKTMGADIEERRDGCVVKGPSRLKGSFVAAHGDHRILMAAAVAALVADGETVVSDGDCFKISYPSFVDDMRSLGTDLELMG